MDAVSTWTRGQPSCAAIIIRSRLHGMWGKRTMIARRLLTDVGKRGDLRNRLAPHIPHVMAGTAEQHCDAWLQHGEYGPVPSTSRAWRSHERTSHGRIIDDGVKLVFRRMAGLTRRVASATS
jgi:hypothetical protein